AGKEIGASDVGIETDAGLRHCERQPLGPHPAATVHRQPHAAAHDYAVDQRDVWLRVALDHRVEPVLLAEECEEPPVARPSEFIERADVAAGTERAAARALDEHALDPVVARPRLEP